MTLGERLLILFVIIAVPLLLIVVPIYLLMGGLNSFALKPLQRCFAGLTWRDSAQAGDVHFVYHTYRGFLLWSTQEEHRVYAPPGDAKQLLWRLLRFNLTWGMLSYGFVFIPLLAIGNYLAQKRAIERQEHDSLTYGEKIKRPTHTPGE